MVVHPYPELGETGKGCSRTTQEDLLLQKAEEEGGLD